MADSEVEEDLSEPCEPGPSGGRNHSKAETDQNNTSRTKDFSEDFEKRCTISDDSSDSNVKTDQSDADFKKRAISKRREEQETAHGNETPQQKKDNGVASQRKGKSPAKKVNRKLPLDANQSKKGTEKTNELQEREDHDGDWLEDHPWKCETPKSDHPTEKTVIASKAYTVSAKWLTNKKVHLEKIYSKLPTFIDEMKGSSIRQELEDVLNSSMLKLIQSEKKNLSPHVLEITQKQPEDNPSVGNDKFKAFSFIQHERSEKCYWFLDCEYMLKMYLPDHSLQWFNNDDQQGKRIREINDEKKEKRWIFIPSFRRAKIALLEWPDDKIVTQESTIRILVVRPSEFEEYVAYCGHKFPIICLPQDEIGTGYPRYWIQKIALRLSLQFIWIIDDSMECFYQYHPDQEPPEPGSYSEYRGRKYGLEFQRIEHFVKEADDDENRTAAMSLRRFYVSFPLETPFVCEPPQCAVYLNLTALSEKSVYYRPELKTLEDIIFGYECEHKSLKVYVDNRIHLKDHK